MSKIAQIIIAIWGNQKGIKLKMSKYNIRKTETISDNKIRPPFL
jgi:hypothetical protein